MKKFKILSSKKYQRFYYYIIIINTYQLNIFYYQINLSVDHEAIQKKVEEGLRRQEASSKKRSRMDKVTF